MMRFAKPVGTFLACIAVGCALKPIEYGTYPTRHGVQVWASGLARRQLDSIAWLTGVLRAEQAACVTAYRVIETESGTVVKIDRLDPAMTHWSDSLNIWVPDLTSRLCPEHTPVLHTHVVENEMWGQPSPVDEATAERRFLARFHVLLSVRGGQAAKLTIYSLR
jgi:hypothetical protein